jgi:transposase-like protein
MDTSEQHCSNHDCPDVGKIDHGNIKVYSYQARRYYCATCGQRFRASQSTVFYKLRTPRQDFLEAVGLLAERCSLRAIARVKAVKADRSYSG